MSKLLFNLETLDENVLEKLKAYEAFLTKWNANINIVSAGNTSKIWERHIVDSLQILPFLDNSVKLADMGCGIGLPALPIAIARPEINVFAIEPNNKKAALVSQLIRELRLPNVHLLPERVQSVIISHMDYVCCRAFGEFSRDSKLAYKMLKPGGSFITFKADPEIKTPYGYQKIKNTEYKLPNYTKSFHIVTAVKIGELD